MRAVNLLPKEFQTHRSIREEDPAVVVGSALAVIVMIALGTAFYAAHTKATSAEKELQQARMELGQLSLKHHPQPKPVKHVVITPIVPPPSITGQEATWLSAVSTNLSQRIAWDRILREVSLVMPDDITLTSLNMTAPTTTAAIPGVTPTAPQQGFTINGNAFSYDSVARLLSRLALVPDLSDVTLTSTSSGAAPGAAASSGNVQFSISASVKGAPAPPAPAPTPTPTPSTGTTATGASA